METAGWKIGTVQEFLQLTEEEHALVEARLAHSRERSDEVPEGSSDDG